MTMESAIMCSDAARLVVESALYKIVHATAAFSQLTGISSDQLMDKPLVDIIDNSSVADVRSKSNIVRLLDNSNAKAKEGKEAEVEAETRSGGNISSASTTKCFVLTTYRIMSNSKVTHFALDFKKISSDTISNEEESMDALDNEATGCRVNQPLHTIG